MTWKAYFPVLPFPYGRQTTTTSAFTGTCSITTGTTGNFVGRFVFTGSTSISTAPSSTLVIRRTFASPAVEITFRTFDTLTLGPGFTGLTGIVFRIASNLTLGHLTFTPPVDDGIAKENYKYYDPAGIKLMRRYKSAPVSRNIYLLLDGTLTTRQPAPELLDKVYWGGHDNIVSPAEAAALQAAGYTVTGA